MKQSRGCKKRYNSRPTKSRESARDDGASRSITPEGHSLGRCPRLALRAYPMRGVLHHFNKSATSDFSSFSSFTLASIFPRLNSLIGTFCTTCGVPSLTCTGNEQIKPFSTPYSPVEHNATLCQFPFGVSVINERTVSTTAFAADAADDKPRALIIAAPRCCTV